MQSLPPPSMIIIHLGSNHLGRYEAKRCRLAVDDGLAIIQNLLPHSYISWSAILPRMLYYGYERYTSQVAIDNVWKNMNKFAKRRILRIPQASFMSHKFDTHEHKFYCRDGIHLSDAGSDVLIGDFATAVQKAGLF